jgi:2-dehydropantoate 2-reductase
MRIAVVGAGGQGGLFGALLAGAGEEVTLIDRGPHLEAIRKRGLRLVPAQGEPVAVAVDAADDPGAVGPVDLVLFCVKTYDLESAISGAGPLVGKDTAVLSVQNGIDAPTLLARAFGRERVVAGVSYLSGNVEKPGVITYGGVSGKLLLGPLDNKPRERLEGIVRAFRRARVDAAVVEDIRTALWEKLVLVCGTGGVLALRRQAIGGVLASADGRVLMRDVMQEAADVSRAAGVFLPEGTPSRLLAFVESSMAPSTRSSLLIDLTAGRRLELETLNGAIVRLGADVGVPTPLNFAIYAALEPYKGGATA